MKLFAIIALLVAAAPSWAIEIYNFDTLPSNGRISGAPGQTIGWGYTLENQSSSQWLVATGLGAGPFAFGTPQVLFDFPILAPGASVIVPFNANTLSGLFALTWNTSAPVGTTESGIFLLNAEWWNGDPFANGQFVSSAAPADRAYSAVVTPEPTTGGLVALLLGSGLWLRRKRG